MTTALKSLVVTVDMDAAGYVRAAQQKAAADELMISSSKSLGAAFAAEDAAAQNTVRGMTRLSRAFIDGYSEAAKFEATMRQIGNAVGQGMSLDRAAILAANASIKFGQVADMAVLAKDGFANLAPVIDQVNAKLIAQADIAAELDRTQFPDARFNLLQPIFNGRMLSRCRIGLYSPCGNWA